MTRHDARFMQESLALAAKAWGETSPNPLVGAVVTRGDLLLGTGFHPRAGASHAEPLALAEAASKPQFTCDAADPLVLYVSLEPCVHQGRTPPCVDAILASPISRIVVPHLDPDPRVAGRGIEQLRRAGRSVDVGCGSAEAAELNHIFIGQKQRGRAFVALKVALSADDCIAGPERERVAITGPEAQRHTHRLRAGHDAVLVGVETLARDRPRLDRRLYQGPGRAPRRIVLDPDLRSDPAWLWPGEEPVPLVFCSEQSRAARGRGYAAELVAVPHDRRGLDLDAVIDALPAHGVWSVLVEGGGDTHRRFIEAGLWDRLWRYRNPALRLAGLPWSAATAWDRAAPIAGAPAIERLGADVLEVFSHPAARLAPESLAG